MAILVAYDGSEPSRKALEYVAEEESDEEITLLRVIEIADGSIDAGFELIQEKLEERERAAEDEAREQVDELPDDPTLEYQIEIVTGKPAREIVAFAEDNDVDHIYMGSHDREGISRILLGSVAEKVVRRSPITVTVVR